MDLSQYLEELRVLVKSWGEEAAGSSTSVSGLDQAYFYSLMAEGKRIRPLLALMSADLLIVNRNKLRGLALSLEYLPTASLIHDDLPCLDNDDLRRGKPTCHKKFGEGVALIAADALIAQAFIAVTNSTDYGAEEKAALTKLLAESLNSLCEGQMLDLQATDKAPELDSKNTEGDLLDIRHSNKTGALIKAAVCGPCILKSLDSDDFQSRALEDFSLDLGLLFQITDDILDVSRSSNELGKTAGKDAREGTITYVSEYGLEQAKELAREKCESAKSHLAPFAEKAEQFSQFCDYILNRTY